MVVSTGLGLSSYFGKESKLKGDLSRRLQHLFAWINNYATNHTHTGTVSDGSKLNQYALGLVKQVEQTSTSQTNISTITDITNMSFTFTLVSGRNYILAGGCQIGSDGGGNARLAFNDGTNNERLVTLDLAASGDSHYMQGQRYYTGSGSITFQLRAECITTTLDLQAAATVPIFMYLFDLGNASV